MNRQFEDKNLDQKVIDDFGQEWVAFDFSESASSVALDAQFLAYSAPIDLKQFNTKTSVAGDFGAGSGRWAARLLPYFSLIYVLEPSDGASKVLKNKFKDETRISILQETVGGNSIPNESLDLAMSLGIACDNQRIKFQQPSCPRHNTHEFQSDSPSPSTLQLVGVPQDLRIPQKSMPAVPSILFV